MRCGGICRRWVAAAGRRLDEAEDGASVLGELEDPLACLMGVALDEAAQVASHGVDGQEQVAEFGCLMGFEGRQRVCGPWVGAWLEAKKVGYVERLVGRCGEEPLDDGLVVVGLGNGQGLRRRGLVVCHAHGRAVAPVRTVGM